MIAQSTPRKSIAKQAATSRRLLAHVSIAPHVLVATIYDEKISDKVVTFKAGRNFMINDLRVAKGESFTMVASRFAHRFYITAHGEWSTKDNRVIAQCNRQVAHFTVTEVA